MAEMKRYKPRRAKDADELLRKGRREVGKGKVKEGISTTCGRNDHSKCFNLRCTCECHKGPS